MRTALIGIALALLVGCGGPKRPCKYGTKTTTTTILLHDPATGAMRPTFIKRTTCIRKVET